MTAAAGTLRAAADVLTLASEAVAAVVIAITDAVGPADAQRDVRPGELRLVRGVSTGTPRRT